MLGILNDLLARELKLKILGSESEQPRYFALELPDGARSVQFDDKSLFAALIIPRIWLGHELDDDTIH